MLGGSVTWHGCRMSFGDDAKVLRVDSGDSCTALLLYVMPLYCTHEWLKQHRVYYVYFTINLKNGLQKVVLGQHSAAPALDGCAIDLSLGLDLGIAGPPKWLASTKKAGWILHVGNLLQLSVEPKLLLPRPTEGIPSTHLLPRPLSGHWLRAACGFSDNN